MKQSFTLDTSFVETYKSKKVRWGGLGYVVFKRTYARSLENGNTEEWYQTIERVVNGTYSLQKNHCKSLNLYWNEEKSQASAKEMYDRIFNFKFLPPGRGLWAMGTDMIYKQGSASLNNCAFVSTEDLESDPVEPFMFLMDMEMLGVGVGADTLGKGKINVNKKTVVEETHIVPDTREGWVELLGIILKAYFVKGATYPSTIDYSLIRPAGLPIKGFGGVSSGKDPLELLVKEITTLLDTFLGDEESKPITSTIIVDICNYIGKCVVAGNVRRTAEIMFGTPDDEEFLDLKTDMEKLSSHRWASNNSVLAHVGMDYTQIAKRIEINGEPGLIWLENARTFGRSKDKNTDDFRVKGTNPCGEQFLESYELCNLVETFPAHHDSLEDFMTTLKYAYLYAKSVTLTPTHNARTNQVMMRNRRIGCSMSGIVQAINKFGLDTFRTFCDQGYQKVKEYDRQYSEWLCIPRSVRMTTVKPSGTVSLLCGATPGVHQEHSEYYIRRVRLSKNSPLLDILIKAGYHTEPCKYQPGSIVVSFPMKVENFKKAKADVTLWEQVALCAFMQQHWSDNSVSNTITFNKQEAKDIPILLSFFEDKLKSVSMLPLMDHSYEQAPYESITQRQYEIMMQPIVDIDDVLVKDTHEETEKFCDGDKCTIKLNQ